MIISLKIIKKCLLSGTFKSSFCLKFYRIRSKEIEIVEITSNYFNISVLLKFTKPNSNLESKFRTYDFSNSDRF